MKNKGFTLIELLVAMTVAAVLMGLALVSLQGARKSARDGKRKADLEQIRSALEMCRADTGSYPAGIYNDISCGNPARTYLSGTPRDPTSNLQYTYLPLPSGCSECTSYNLCANLESGGSPVSGCGSCSNCNYKVTNP